MEKLKYAQDLIKTRSGSVAGGFNMFIGGYDRPKPNDWSDYNERTQGFDYAEKMAKENSIAFTHRFSCDCGGHAFQYGGFFVCNSCGGKGVDKDWWQIKVEKDGNAYCCHGLDFINLQESDNVAFGDTFNEAIKNYGQLMLQVLPTNKKGVADVGIKICTKCNTNKNIKEFSFVYGHKRKDGTKKGSYHSQCKICRKSVLKNWRNKNPEKSKNSCNNWIKNNLEKNKETRKKYKIKNKELVIKWKWDWDIKNRDKLTDSYVIGQITKRSFLTAKTVRKHPELIEVKKIIIKTKRLCKTSQN